MHETSMKMIRAEFLTCVEEATIPHKILLTNEEKRLLGRPKNRGISSVWIRRMRIGFVFFTSGSNYFFESDNKHFGSIKYSKFLRNWMTHQFLNAFSSMKKVWNAVLQKIAI